MHTYFATKYRHRLSSYNHRTEWSVELNLPEVIVSQYLAALEMLRQTVSKCPPSLWNSSDDGTKFWHIAYHALFYTHLYLQDSEQTFTPWIKHRDEYQFFDRTPWPPFEQPKIGEPFDKDGIFEYLVFCRGQVVEQVPRLNLDGPSGFDWLPFSKLELQFYNIRHLQQHTGELMERLGTRADVELDWVGTKHE
jgi:hypothetical protein